MFEPVKNSMPVIIFQGDADQTAPVANTRRWIQKTGDMGMTYRYVEVQGGTHGNVLNISMPQIF